MNFLPVSSEVSTLKLDVFSSKRPTDTERRSKISITHQASVRPCAVWSDVRSAWKHLHSRNQIPAFWQRILLHFCSLGDYDFTDGRALNPVCPCKCECVSVCVCARHGCSAVSCTERCLSFQSRSLHISFLWNATPQVKWLNVQMVCGRVLLQWGCYRSEWMTDALQIWRISMSSSAERRWCVCDFSNHFLCVLVRDKCPH